MKIKSVFDINQQVYIKQLKIWGKVIGIYIDSDNGTQYNIRYFTELKPQTCYFHVDELSLQESDSVLGFQK